MNVSRDVELLKGGTLMSEPMYLLLMRNRFLSSMKMADVHLLGQFGKICTFEVHEKLAREGELSTCFYLLLEGAAIVESCRPFNRAINIQTLYGGDLVGLHGMFPPHLWHFDIRALSPIRAVAFDAALVRKECEDHAVFGYELMQRIAHNLAIRLTDVRLQVLEANLKSVQSELQDAHEYYDDELRI